MILYKAANRKNSYIDQNPVMITKSMLQNPFVDENFHEIKDLEFFTDVKTIKQFFLKTMNYFLFKDLKMRGVKYSKRDMINQNIPDVGLMEEIRGFLANDSLQITFKQNKFFKLVYKSLSSIHSLYSMNIDDSKLLIKIKEILSLDISNVMTSSNIDKLSENQTKYPNILLLFLSMNEQKNKDIPMQIKERKRKIKEISQFLEEMFLKSEQMRIILFQNLQLYFQETRMSFFDKFCSCTNQQTDPNIRPIAKFIVEFLNSKTKQESSQKIHFESLKYLFCILIFLKYYKDFDLYAKFNANFFDGVKALQNKVESQYLTFLNNYDINREEIPAKTKDLHFTSYFTDADNIVGVLLGSYSIISMVFEIICQKKKNILNSLISHMTNIKTKKHQRVKSEGPNIIKSLNFQSEKNSDFQGVNFKSKPTKDNDPKIAYEFVDQTPRNNIMIEQNPLEILENNKHKFKEDGKNSASTAKFPELNAKIDNHNNNRTNKFNDNEMNINKNRYNKSAEIPKRKLLDYNPPMQRRLFDTPRSLLSQLLLMQKGDLVTQNDFPDLLTSVDLSALHIPTLKNNKEPNESMSINPFADDIDQEDRFIKTNIQYYMHIRQFLLECFDVIFIKENDDIPSEAKQYINDEMATAPAAILLTLKNIAKKLIIDIKAAGICPIYIKSSKSIIFKFIRSTLELGYTTRIQEQQILNHSISNFKTKILKHEKDFKWTVFGLYGSFYNYNQGIEFTVYEPHEEKEYVFGNVKGFDHSAVNFLLTSGFSGNSNIDIYELDFLKTLQQLDLKQIAELFEKIRFSSLQRQDKIRLMRIESFMSYVGKKEKINNSKKTID